MTKSHSKMRWTAFGFLFIITGISKAQAQADTSKVGKDTLLNQQSEELKSALPVITLDESDADNGDASDGQTISSVLYGGRDPFYSSLYNFNISRFRIRGYDPAYTDTYLNGVSVRSATSGMTTWSLWGGLNDVVNSRSSSFGLRSVDFGYGDIGGTNFIDTRASRQRKGASLSYAYTNGNYNHRIMGSYSTGLMQNGWAFTAAGSYRYADEGYVKGTHYSGSSYFLSIDKKINDHHLLSFTTFGTPTKNAMQSAAVMEAINLTGDKYYNPSWGYQNGEKRSANERRNFQPYFILNHEWTINSKSSLVTAAAYQFGNSIRTALDWYNAPDPRPDYYRNLPSYYLENDNADAAAMMTKLWQTDDNVRQINWDHFYEVNRNSIATVDGTTGRRSRYILSDRYTGTNHLTFNTYYNNKLTNYLQLSAGLSYNQQIDRNYEKVNDLLGGDFWLNVNQFAERSYPNNSNINQYDIDNPNRLVKVDDKYGYDYKIGDREAKAFAQLNFTFQHFDFFVAGNYTYTDIWREGMVRNGLFPENSMGKSKTYNFNNGSVKGGVTYKIDGRNYLFANASFGTRAPYASNMFISPRNRNTAQDDIASEKIFSAEAGYILNWEKLKFRLNGFYTTMRNGMDIMSYYDDSYANFVNYALTGIGRQYYGMETGIEVPVYGGFTAKAAANIGRYMYDTRQNAIVTVDNSATIVANETVYAKNFRLSQTPQEAYSAGLSYQGKHNWFANINWNYFAQMWETMNPIRRTIRATQGLQPGSDQWNSIIDQDKLPSTYSVNFYGGKTVYVKSGKKSMPLSITLGLNNLTNNRRLITSGFEQLRYDNTNQTPNTFPTKYYYAYGISFFGSVALKF